MQHQSPMISVVWLNLNIFNTNSSVDLFQLSPLKMQHSNDSSMVSMLYLHVSNVSVVKGSQKTLTNKFCVYSEEQVLWVCNLSDLLDINETLILKNKLFLRIINLMCT